MTEDQKKIKRYVNQLERRLRLPLELKVRINGDIGTEIHQRMESGQTVDQVFQEMGIPDEVAASFNREFSEFEIRKNPIRFLFLIMAVMAAAGELWYIGGSFANAEYGRKSEQDFLKSGRVRQGQCDRCMRFHSRVYCRIFYCSVRKKRNLCQIQKMYYSLSSGIYSRHDCGCPA